MSTTYIIQSTDVQLANGQMLTIVTDANNCKFLVENRRDFQHRPMMCFPISFPSNMAELPNANHAVHTYTLFASNLDST